MNSDRHLDLQLCVLNYFSYTCCLSMLQVNGHVVATYDIGNGKKTIVESRRVFSDGRYHYVTFRRRDNAASLRVDDYSVRTLDADGE